MTARSTFSDDVVAAGRAQRREEAVRLQRLRVRREGLDIADEKNVSHRIRQYCSLAES